MESEDVAFAGIAAQADMLRSGEISSRELTDLCLDRIERLDPKLNSFREVFAEQARSEAGEADERRASGEDLPLLGVPVAFKDEVGIKGHVAGHGTAAFNSPATADDEHVRRIRDAGALIIGVTNLPELAICGFTETESNGITRNPWGLGHTPGGSSGGSAAAVAAGLVGAASGSDGAGSIRIPAANCGLFGLKPQRGRVSLAPESQHWTGLSAAGCLSRKVLDTALWLDLAAGNIEGDAHRPEPLGGSLVAAAANDPGHLRVAVSTTAPRALARPYHSDEVEAAVHRMADTLKDMGHEIQDCDPRYGSVGNSIVPRYLAGIAEHAATVPHPEKLDSRTRGFVKLGRAIPGRVLRRALDHEAGEAARLNGVFAHADVLLTPVTATPPVEIGRWDSKGALRTVLGMSRVYPHTVTWNHTGQPAASIPAGFTTDGLPIGVMLVVPPGRELLLVSLSAQLEHALAWPDTHPNLVGVTCR